MLIIQKYHIQQCFKRNLYGFTFDNYTAEDMSNMSSIEEM